MSPFLTLNYLEKAYLWGDIRDKRRLCRFSSSTSQTQHFGNFVKIYSVRCREAPTGRGNGITCIQSKPRPFRTHNTSGYRTQLTSLSPYTVHHCSSCNDHWFPSTSLIPNTTRMYLVHAPPSPYPRKTVGLICAWEKRLWNNTVAESKAHCSCSV